jgi:DNA-binding NarL/FixJ family response regulator
VNPARTGGDQARTVLLLDRHPLWLDAVEALFSQLGFAVVGKLASAERAIAAIVEAPPDVLVTDVDTEDGPMTGIRVIRAAKDANPDAAVIVVSAREEDEVLESAFDGGASAFVLKSASPEDLAVAALETADRSVFTAVPAGRRARVPSSEGENPLTRRELAVLELAARGRSNALIAEALRITEPTVKLHLSNAYRKLGAANRTDASRRAIGLGLFPPPSHDVEGHLFTGRLDTTTSITFPWRG